ncbi:MAG: hypothetical protein ABL957_12035 [Parvularculaceae bacterium]
MRSLGVALVALSVFGMGSAGACEVSSLSGLRSSDVESVTYQMGAHRPEMPLEDSRRVVALVGFLKRLGTNWAPGGASSNDGVIRFYESGDVAAKVFVGTNTVATDRCKRKLNQDELDELYSILIEG